MIPNDSYTTAMTMLLVALGLLGLLLPRWFHRISRFPFIWEEPLPYTDAARRRARIWGAVSLGGALFLLYATG